MNSPKKTAWWLTELVRLNASKDTLMVLELANPCLHYIPAYKPLAPHELNLSILATHSLAFTMYIPNDLLHPSSIPSIQCPKQATIPPSHGNTPPIALLHELL
jgi:hypothetical protein